MLSSKPGSTRRAERHASRARVTVERWSRTPRERSYGLPRSQPTRPAATRPESGWATRCHRTRRCSASPPRSDIRRPRSWHPIGSGKLGQFRVRYFSPLAEVPFCGHATIASGVAIAERRAGWVEGGAQDPIVLVFVTNNGPVAVSVARGPDGMPRATLTSVQPSVQDPGPGSSTRALALLDWHADELDPTPTAGRLVCGRKTPRHCRTVARDARAARLPVRGPEGADARGRLDDDPARLAAGAGSFPGARSLPGRRCRRGPGDGRRRGRARGLPAREGRDHAPRVVRDPPGRRDGPRAGSQ